MSAYSSQVIAFGLLVLVGATARSPPTRIQDFDVQTGHPERSHTHAPVSARYGTSQVGNPRYYLQLQWRAPRSAARLSQGRAGSRLSGGLGGARGPADYS